MAWRGGAGEGNGERARWSEGEVGRRGGGGEREGREMEMVGEKRVIQQVHTN